MKRELFFGGNMKIKIVKKTYEEVLEMPTWCPEILFQFIYMAIVFIVSLLVSWLIGTFVLKPIQRDIEKLILKL